MRSDIRQLVRQIHDSPVMAVVAVTGGGIGSLQWLLGVPGASRTVLEAVVPYAESALASHIGYRPGKLVTMRVAQDMADRAYERARELAQAEAHPLVGIGCTATIATDRKKKGDHHFYVAMRSESRRIVYSMTFVKGLRDRDAEDEIVSLIVLRALAKGAELRFDIPIEIDERETIKTYAPEEGDAIDLLIARRVPVVTVERDGEIRVGGKAPGVILSGSFNPLHHGHVKLLQAASRMLGNAEAAFELSIRNVDKPPLEACVVRERVEQFRGKHPVLLTRAPTFAEKARLFPGCAFVVGYDTAVRLFDPKYYSGDVPSMIAALVAVRESGGRFLVAGRRLDGAFRTLDSIEVPSGLSDLLTPIPETEFRADISSTELRTSGQE